MDKQNMLCQYNGILFIHKKNEVLIHATTWMNLKKQYAKWKKAVIEDHIVYISIYTKCPE